MTVFNNSEIQTGFSFNKKQDKLLSANKLLWTSCAMFNKLPRPSPKNKFDSTPWQVTTPSYRPYSSVCIYLVVIINDGVRGSF